MHNHLAKFFLAILASAVVVSLALGPQSAAAQSKKSTKLLVMKVESEALDDAARTQLTKDIRAGLAKYPNLSLLPTPEVDLLDLIIELECTDMDVECFQKIADQHKADEVLYTEASGSAAAPDVVFKHYVRKKDKIVKEARGVAAGADAIGLMLVQSFGPLPVPKKKEPVKPPPSKKTRVAVKLTTSVPGATVTMSGVKLGKTPLSRKLKPGRYSITVAKDGYVAIKQKVAVVAGDAQKLHFELVPVKKPVVATTATTVATPDSDPTKAAAKAEQGSPFYKQWWFWTAVGVAVAGIVTTSVVLSIDDEPLPTGTVNFGISSPDYDPLVRGNK